MAQLKDLIVNGPSRFIGDVYATTFTGNLAGNANTATSATNAGMVAGLSVHSGRNNEANKIVRTDQNGYLQVGYINSSSGHEKNASNPTYVWGSNSSDSYLRSYQTSSLSVNYATSSGSCSGNAATATKAGCLDTGGMVLYANHNNEINFGGTTASSIIFFGYRAAESKPIPTSFVFGGSNGTALLTASGFKKNGSSASYVLTGDGGHAAISSLSVNYANSSGSCSGNAATATNASSAGNADKLDGVHYQNILERFYSGYSSSGTATGWFRIAETLIDDGMGPTFLLAIQRGYSYTNNESYLFSISVSFGGGISITQLSGYANTRLITKIRVDWAHSHIAYVDLYISSSSKTNDYFWYTVGCAKSYTDWIANPTLVGQYPQEFTTVQGCKSDKGFTGYLTGTASSASKWVYARTITLTGSVTGSVSIDGSGDVSLATTTNHTHNYAGSSSAGGSANSALTLLYNNKFDTTYGDYAIFQQNYGMSDFPHTGWFNSIKMLHNNSYGYFTEIATSFTGEDGMWRRALVGGGQLGWYKMLDSGNYNSYAPKLDGTGASGTWGINISGNAATATNADTLDGYHASSFYKHATAYPYGRLDKTWHKIATFSQSVHNAQINTSIAFYVSEFYDSKSYGIFTVRARAEANSASLTFLSVDFLVNAGIPTTQIVATWKNAGDNNIVINVYACRSGWSSFSFRKIEEQSWGLPRDEWITLEAINGNENCYASIPSDENQGVSTNIDINNNVASATKLANSRTIWGHNFDGTGNVSGALSGVTNINSTLYIDSSGNVGIGTTSPSYKLHVNGDGYFVDNVITEGDFSSRGDAIIDGHATVNSLKTHNICIECDNSGNSSGHGSEINNYSSPLYIQYSTSNNCCICYGGGNVGIGITSPTYKLHVYGDARINGTISCIKLSQTSDIKYKTNIKQIEYEEALKIIENLNPVTWDWNENTVETGSSSGFVAQEAEEFIPNAISRDNENNLSLDYTQLHSYEIKVIQEQQKEIIKLKEKLKILEKLIS